MQSVYKYRFSRTTLYWTVVYLAAFGLLGWLLYHLYEGGYLSAWFTSFIVALVALMALSIPRRIGGFGFFGYYGHFLDLRRFDRVKLYASEWKNFVEITDIYEDRLFVSCTEADRLVAELTPPGGNRPDEEEADDEEEAEEAAASRPK